MLKEMNKLNNYIDEKLKTSFSTYYTEITFVNFYSTLYTNRSEHTTGTSEKSNINRQGSKQHKNPGRYT